MECIKYLIFNMQISFFTGSYKRLLKASYILKNNFKHKSNKFVEKFSFQIKIITSLKDRNKFASDKNFSNKIRNYMKNKKQYLIALILNISPYFFPSQIPFIFSNVKSFVRIIYKHIL